MVLACKSIHLADGYALNSTNGFGFTSAWVKVVDYNILNISATFVGGSPQGGLILQQSNDLEADTGAAMGGGGGAPVYPVATGPATSIPLWADPYRGSSYASDVATVPSGLGTVSATVAAAGTFLLNQYWFGYSFVRLVYTPTSNVVTALSIKMTVKG